MKLLLSKIFQSRQVITEASRRNPITPEVAKKKLKHRVRQNKTARLRKCSSWDIATTVKDNGIYERHDQIRKKLIELDHRMEITESSILQNYKELKEEVDKCKLDIVKYGAEGGSIREYSEEAQEIIKLENRLTMAEEIFKTNFDKIESRVEEDNAKLMSDRQELIEERERLMEISYDLAILQESMNTHSEDINFVKSVSIDLRTADSVLSENLDEIQEIIGKVDEEIKYIKGIQTETEEKYAQVIITEDMSNNAINELREEIRRCQGEIKQLRENQNVIVDELSTDINSISEEVKDEVSKITDEMKEKLGEEKAEFNASFDAILNDVKALKENLSNESNEIKLLKKKQMTLVEKNEVKEIMKQLNAQHSEGFAKINDDIALIKKSFAGKHEIESELENINNHIFEVEENLSNESNEIKLLKEKQMTLIEKNEVEEMMTQLNTQNSDDFAKVNEDIALIKETFAGRHEVESELENISKHFVQVEENIFSESNEIKLLKDKQLTFIEKNEVKEMVSEINTQNSEDFTKINDDIALIKETFAGRHEVESELENISKHFVQVEENIFSESNEIKLLKEKQLTFIERNEVKEMVSEMNTQNSEDFTKINDDIALIKETFAGRHEVESELENISKQFKKVEDVIFNESNEIKLLKEKQLTLIEKEEVTELLEQLKHEQNTDLTKIKNDLKEEKEEIDNIKQSHQNFVENTEMKMNLMNNHFMQLEEIIYSDNNEIELLKEKQSTLIEMSDVHDLFTQLKTEQEQLSDVIEKVRDDSNVDKTELEKTIRENHDQFMEQMSQHQVALSEEFGKLENKIKTEKKEIDDIRENLSYFAGKREVTGEINNLNEHFKRLNETLNLQIETVQTIEDKQTSFVEKSDLNKLIDDLNNEKLTLADIISKLTEGFEEDQLEIASLKKNQELYSMKIDTDSELNSINEKISQIEKTVFDEKDRINSLKNKQEDMIEKHEVIELINKIITNQEKNQGDIKSVQNSHSDLVDHVSIELNALNDHIGILEVNLHDENMKIKDIIESESRFVTKDEISVEIQLLNDILSELGNDFISHLDETKNKMATTEDVGKIVDDFCIIDELLISHIEQIKDDMEKDKVKMNECKHMLLMIEELKNSKVDIDNFNEYKEKNSSKRKNLIKGIDEMNTENEWLSESISKLEEDQEISKEDIETLKDHQLKLTETNDFLALDIEAERIELDQYKELLDQLIESNDLYNDQHQLIKTIFKSVEEQLMTHLNLLDKRVGKLETSKDDDVEMFNLITDQQNELSTLVNQLGTVDCFTDEDYNELQNCLADLHSNINMLHERETLRDNNEAASEFTDKVNTLGSIMDQLKISLQNNNASGKEGDLKALLSHLAMSKVEEIVKQIRIDVQAKLDGNDKDVNKANEKIDPGGRMNSFIELKVSDSSDAEIPLDELDLKVKKELMKLPDQDLSDETETLHDDDETIPEDVETLPEDVDTLLEDVETLPDDVETLPEDVETLPEDVETLPEDVEALPVDVETLPEDVETLPEDVKTLPDINEFIPNNDETIPQQIDEIVILPSKDEAIPSDVETIPNDDESTLDDEETLPADDKIVSEDDKIISDVIDDDDDNDNDDEYEDNDDQGIRSKVKTSLGIGNKKVFSDGTISDQIVADTDVTQTKTNVNGNKPDNIEFSKKFKTALRDKNEKSSNFESSLNESRIKPEEEKRSPHAITDKTVQDENLQDQNEIPHDVISAKNETLMEEKVEIFEDAYVQNAETDLSEETTKEQIDIKDASLFKEDEDLGDENILALEEDLHDLKKSLTLFEKTFENMPDFKKDVKDKEDIALADKENIQTVNDSLQNLKKDLLAFKEDIDNQSQDFEAEEVLPDLDKEAVLKTRTLGDSDKEEKDAIKINKEVTKEGKDGDRATEMRNTSSVEQIKSPLKHSKMNKEYEEDEKDVDTSCEEEKKVSEKILEARSNNTGISTTATTKAADVSAVSVFEQERKNEELIKETEKEEEVVKRSEPISVKGDMKIENPEVRSQTKIEEVVTKEDKYKKEKSSVKKVDNLSNQTKTTAKAKTKNIRSKTATSTGLRTGSQKPQKISATKDQSKTSSKGKTNQEQPKVGTKSQKVKDEKTEPKGADKLSGVKGPSKKQSISSKSISSSGKKSQTGTRNPISDGKVKTKKKKKVPDVLKSYVEKHEALNQNKIDLQIEETNVENISDEKDSAVNLSEMKVEMEGKLILDENSESKVEVLSESIDIRQKTFDDNEDLSKNEIHVKKLQIEDAELKTEKAQETVEQLLLSESEESENTILSSTNTRKKESKPRMSHKTRVEGSNINEIQRTNINDEFNSESFVCDQSFSNQTNILQYNNMNSSQTHSNSNLNLLSLVNTLITNASAHSDVTSDVDNESTDKNYTTLIHELQLLAKAAEDGDENAIRDLNLGNLASTNSCTPIPSFIQTNIKNEFSNTSNINLIGPLPESIEMPPPGVMSSADHIMDMRADRVTKHIVGDLIDRLSEAENFTRKNVSKLGEVVAKQSEAIQLLNERQDEVANKNTALDLVDQLITDGQRIRESFRKLKEDVERDNAEIRRMGQDNLAALEDKFDAAHQSLSENFEMLQNVVAQFGEEMSFIKDINFEGSFDAITSEILSIRDEIGQNQDNIFSVQDEQIRLAALTDDFMESEGILRKNYAEMQAVVASVYEEFERAKNVREIDTSSESGTDLNILRYLQVVDDLKSEQGKMDSKMEEMKNMIEEKNKEDVQLMREELEKQTEENTKATLESLKMEMNKEAEKREELLQEKINEENDIRTKENIMHLKEELDRNTNELKKQSEEQLQEKMISLKGEIDAETKVRENSIKEELLKQNQESTTESISVLKEELAKDAKEMGETFKEEIAKQKEILDKEIEERDHSMKEELAIQREELDKESKERVTLMKEELAKQKEELNQEALKRDSLIKEELEKQREEIDKEAIERESLMKEELAKQKEEIEHTNERFDTLKEELGKQNEALDKETKERIEENAIKFRDEFAKHKEKVSNDTEEMKAVQANLIDQFMSAKTHLKDDFMKIQNLVGKVDKELEVLKELKKKEKQQQAIDSKKLGEMKEDLGDYKNTTDNEIKALKDKQDKLMILKDQFRTAEESLQSDFDNIQGLVMNVDEELEELKEKNKKKANLETVVVLAERLTVTEEYTFERLEELRLSIERDNKEISLLKAKQEAMTDKEELMKLVEKVDSLEQLLTDNYERLREEVNTSNEKMKLLIEKEEERNVNETIKKLAERLSLTEELLRENFEKITSGLGMNLTEIRELKRHQDIEEYVVIALSGRLTVLEEAFNDSVPQLKKELHKEGRIIDVLLNKHTDGEHAIDELRAKRTEDQVIIKELKTKQDEAEEVMKKLLERQDATEKELQKADNQMTVAEINLKSDITELDEKVVKAIEKMDQTMVENFDQNIADTKAEFNQRLDQAIEKIDQVVVDTNSKIDEKFNLTDNKLSEFIIKQLTPLLDETTKQTNTMEVVKSKLNEYVHCDELTALTKRVHNYETSTVDALTQLNTKINNENNETQSIKDTIKKEAEKRREIEDHIENIENILFLDETSDTDNSKLQWVLSHYKHHFTKGKPVYSPIFFTQLNGYRFQLGINWLGEKKGSLGIYLYLHKGKFEGKDIPPFTVPYTLGLQNKKTDNRSTKVSFLTESSKDKEEVSNNRQKKEKGSHERKYVELREGSEPLPSIELIDDVTVPYKPYLLPMPSLDDYVVNDTLTVFCTFKPQQQE